MINCYDDPDTVHTVLGKATEFLIAYAKAYREAGANGILMAEPVAGLLSPTLEEEFAAPYVKQIIDAVQSDEFAVIYHNCGNNTPMMIPSMLSVGAMAYHFGNAIDLSVMLDAFPADIPVMGNVDPAGVLKDGTPETVRAETLALMEKCSKYPNFVVSSGCDIPPASPWENLDAFFSAVEEFNHGRQ
jgi:uroporphyrinogen decarboxylase